MPYAHNDDIRLHYEEAGAGAPVVFVHELAGDHRSWEPQMRALSGRYRCIALAARGYAPSDVPDALADYAQDYAPDDVIAVLDAAGIDAAHVVGLSMGGFTALHLGLRHAPRILSLVVASCGYGSEPAAQAAYKREIEALAERVEREGMAAFAEFYGAGPYRLPLKAKNAEAWRRFVDQLAEHSPQGFINTLRGIQARRPSLWALEEGLARLAVPVLVMQGEEDEPCRAAGPFLKRTIPQSRLLVIPRTGHTINLEEPELFNRALGDFFATVESGRWRG